jgi:hypothetical protein
VRGINKERKVKERARDEEEKKTWYLVVLLHTMNGRSDNLNNVAN